MSSQEVEGFAQEVQREDATSESLQAAVPPEQPQMSSTSRKVTWKSSPSYWGTHCYSMGTMLILVICLEGQHLRDEILYTIVHYIFSVHSVEVNEEDEKFYNRTLLHHCAGLGNDRLCSILIGRGADVNAQESSTRWTPLHRAVNYNQINVVKVMLSHDSDGVTLDTTLRDSAGKTALDLAKERNREGFLVLLMNDESVKNERKKEELQTAAMVEDIIGGKDEASVLRVRMYLIGKYATGKSSFVRALLGEEFIENANSTESISIHRSRFRMHLSSPTATGTQEAAQVLVDNSQHSFFANLLTARIRSSLDLVKKIKEAPEIPIALPIAPQPSAWFKLKEFATSLFHGTTTSPLPNTASFTVLSASAVNNEFAYVPHAKDLTKVAPDVISQVRSSVRNVDNSSNEAEAAYAFVELWDMGGQMPMLVQQSISFSVCDSVYIVTLDMRCGLDEEVTEDVYRFDGQEIVTSTPLPGMTQADYLHMCLSLIALQHRADTTPTDQQQPQPDTETGKSSSSDSSHHHDESSTAVMVVVTHVDLVEDNHIEKKKDMFVNAVSKLTEMAGPKVKICGPFFVDNHRLQDQVSRHSQLAEAQQELSRIVSAFPVQAIPLMQVKIEEAISLHRKIMLRSAMAGCSDDTMQATSSDQQQQQQQQRQQQSFVSMDYPQFVDFCRHVSGKDLTTAQVSDLLHRLQQHGTVFCCDCPHPLTSSVIFLEPQQLLLDFVRLMTFPLKETAFPSTSATLVREVQHFRRTGIASARLIEEVWYPLSRVVQLALCKAMCYFNLAAELQPASSAATSSTATSSTATSSTATSSTATSSTATSSTATSSTATSSTATSSTATSSAATSSTATSSTAASSTATSSTATSSTATSSTVTSSTATSSTAASSTATSSTATSSTVNSSTATSSTDTSTGGCGSRVGGSSNSSSISRQDRCPVVTSGLPDLFIPFCCNQEALRLVLEDDVPFKLPFNHLSFPGMLFPPPLFGRLVTYIIHRMKKESASLQFISSAVSLNLEVGCSQVCLCWTPTGVRLECAADTTSILADVAWDMKSAIVDFTQVLSTQGYQQFTVVGESFACTSTSCQDRLKECSSPAEVLVHSSWVLLTSLHKKHFLKAYESDMNTALTFKATCATCKEKVIVPRSFWPWLRKDVPFVQAEPLSAPSSSAAAALAPAEAVSSVPTAAQGTAVPPVHFAEQSTDVAASSHFVEAAYPDGNPCMECKQGIQVPSNSHCWFNDTEFKLEGRSNKDAIVAISALSHASPNDSDLEAVVDRPEEVSLDSVDVQVEDVAPDESPEYRYVSEADTEQIPIRREGTVLFMEGGKVEFLAGTVSDTIHISPPVHMMFQGTLPSEHGDGVTLHSVMAFASHEAKFRRPVQVEIDVPRIAETDQIYLVHFPGTTPESAEASGFSETRQLPTSHKCCTVVHVGNSTWTVTKLPGDKPYEIPAKQVDLNATLDRPEEDECPYSGITVDYQRKKIYYSKKHFCYDVIYTYGEELSLEQIGMLPCTDKLKAWRVWVYGEKIGDRDPAHLHIMAIPAYGPFLEPPPKLLSPPDRMSQLARSRYYFLLKEGDSISYKFKVYPEKDWQPACVENPPTFYKLESSARFESREGTGGGGSVGPPGVLECRSCTDQESIEHVQNGKQNGAGAESGTDDKLKVVKRCTIPVTFTYERSLPGAQDSSEEKKSSPTPATNGVSHDGFMSKTLAQITDWFDFEGALRNFVVGDERKKFGRAAVILANPKMRNAWDTELDRFHTENARRIFGDGEGMDNLFCIILYLINNRQEMTIKKLFGMLEEHAPIHRDDIRTALSEAAYND
ncbi:uncharacterized protein LOC135822541 isoform X2 [Sycon ciliatum]|uniref:uncharacterized protein LOC135822541 isoform X2 n=1 Tax=Sycon ciliatum TaxID=27933 RepID=UPI0031F6A0F9